jgi:hypothetical protein
MAWVRRLPEPKWPLTFPRPPGGGKTVAIWSQDKDFEVSGLAVWKTGQVLRAFGLESSRRRRILNANSPP